MEKTQLMTLLLALILLIPSIAVPIVLFRFGTFAQLGPEGVDAKLHGVEWSGPLVQDGGLKTVSTAHPSDRIGIIRGPVGTSTWTEYSWASPDAYNPEIQRDVCLGGVMSSLVCKVRTRQAEVHEVNIHGDPLGTRSPTEIVWYTWESKTREETTGNRTEVEWTRYEAFVVPVDYVIEISVRALTKGASGSFQDLHLWYVMDTVRWHNAFAEPYGSLESNSPPPEGAELKAYNYRGAFPIWAWIDTWDPFVYEDEAGSSLDLPSEVPDEMEDYTQISPSMEGSRLTLYHEPTWEYVEMYAKDIVKDDTKLGDALESEIAYLPDPRFAETVFTPITLNKFGVYHSSTGWWLWHQEKWCYPTAYIRVRALYVIWGKWIYLWTHEEAEEQGYEWQNRTSVIYHHDSTWNQFWGGVGTAWGNLVRNPLFWLWLSLIGGIVFIVLVFIALGPRAITLFSGWLRKKVK